MRDKLLKIITVTLFCFCFLIIGFFTALELVSYDDMFFRSQYQKNLAVSMSGMQEDELMRVTDEMQLFLREARADFNICGVVDGVFQPVFDEQEQVHMLDVQKLYHLGRTLRNICFVVAAALVAGLLRFGKKQILFSSLRMTPLITLVFLIAVCGFGFFFFERLFVIFHELLFSNDLWLFDYDSILINMLPESFFRAAALRIAVYNLIFYCILFSAGFMGLKAQRRRLEDERKNFGD